ncbi:MAG: hypothetical protein IIA55_06530 [Gemmatimonadetes bacterium]|nr:hypothetical protein [Gemmatimonadota bacterium]
MKRISFLVLLMFAVSPGLGRTRSHGYYTTRIQYSPYAFGIHSSGLVPSWIHYSPYAFGVNHSGLVSDYYVDYTPYAFGTRHSGLVSQLGIHPLPLVTWYDEGRRGMACLVDPTRSHARADRPAQHRRVIRSVPARGRIGRGADLAWRIDQKTIARNCLDKVIPGRYRITRHLRIGGETVSFDIHLKDMGCIIKYWNQPKINAIKENAGSDERVYSRYLNSWARLANEFELEGGEVRHLVSYDERKIPEKLAGLLPVRVAHNVK